MKKYGKIAVLLLVAGLILVYFQLGLSQYFSLNYLKSQQNQFTQFYTDNPLLTIGLYMAIYIASTSLSLPGAALLTLLGGALFGLVTGTIIVSFSSTIGATLAFLVSRFILQDSVQQRFGTQLKKINDGIEREGAFYLFTLRLIPAVPFFVINLVMGLTPMRVLTFFIVSQIGMFPGTIVFVNAGTQLAKIDSLKGILSPSLLLSFALLGLFPIVTKKIMGWLRKNNKGLENGKV